MTEKRRIDCKGGRGDRYGRDVGGHLSSRRLERWYTQLQQTLAAGIDLPTAFEQCAGPPSRDRMAMAQALRFGRGVDTVLESAPSWLPVADRYLLSSGAASGRLSETCATLAAEHADLAANRRALWMAAIYPLVILQGSLFLFPAARSISIDCDANPHFSEENYVFMFTGLMVGVWGSLAFSIFIQRTFPHVAEHILRLLPGIGSYWRHRTVARFASTLDALLESGARYVEAVGGAALAVNDTRLTPAVLAQLAPIEAGQPLSAVLPRIRAIPRAFTEQFHTGEVTGQLHKVLPRLAEDHRQSARKALFHIAFWYPKLLFLAAAAAVGYSVASVYGEYLAFVLKLAE